MATATATIQVTIEVAASGSWGDNCTVDQIKRQAADSVRGRLRQMQESNNFRVVGDINNLSISTIKITGL